jgi:hypothetical protein
MKSQYGNRETVGSTYLEAQKDTAKGYSLQDFNNPMTKDLIEDLNDTIESNPFEGRPFYINFVEERDLLMKNAFKRRIFKTKYRPYPEDNTLVFYTDPKIQKTYFCWQVPHHSELYNILSNFTLYDKEYVDKLRQWMNNDLSSYGFLKVTMGSSHVEGYDDKTINLYRDNYITFLKTKGLSDEDIETEKRLGFFWVPNTKFQYQDVTAKSLSPKLILS